MDINRILPAINISLSAGEAFLISGIKEPAADAAGSFRSVLFPRIMQEASGSQIGRRRSHGCASAILPILIDPYLGFRRNVVVDPLGVAEREPHAAVRDCLPHRPVLDRERAWVIEHRVEQVIPRYLRGVITRVARAPE